MKAFILNLIKKGKLESEELLSNTNLKNRQTAFLEAMAACPPGNALTDSISNFSSPIKFYRTVCRLCSSVIAVTCDWLKPLLNRQHLIALGEHRTLHSAFENHKRVLRKSDIRCYIQKTQCHCRRMLSCHLHRYKVRRHPMS